MPGLDVSWVVSDPMLADVISVVRRQDVRGTNGRAVPTVTETWPAITAVVTQQSPADLLRRDDSEIVPRRIFVASTFCFRGATRDAQGLNWMPDLITWNGTQYLVTEVLPYSRYGVGIYEVIAESMTAVDVPQ